MISRILCFFGIHQYVPIKVIHYKDISYEKDGYPSTQAVYKCQSCKVIMTKAHYAVGYLSIEELK